MGEMQKAIEAKEKEIKKRYEPLFGRKVNYYGTEFIVIGIKLESKILEYTGSGPVGFELVPYFVIAKNFSDIEFIGLDMIERITTQ